MPMNATEFITIMYGMVGIIATIGYFPQVIKLVKSKRCDGISVKSWILWTYTSSVSVIYAFYVMSDPTFQFVTGINFVGTVIILCLTIYQTKRTIRAEKALVSLQNK